MFVEGYIDKEFLRILKEAGFDIVWECKTRNDLIKHGYDIAAEKDGINLTKETVARIFLDGDMEETLMPILIADFDSEKYSEESGAKTRSEGVRRKLLPMMAVCGNERMRDYAIQELKNVEV